MDTVQYTVYWQAVLPVMKTQLASAVEIIRPRLPAGLTIIDPVARDDSDEFAVSAEIKTTAETFVLGLDFVLRDGDVHGGEGLAVVLQIIGYGGIPLGEYAPHNYTDEAFTFDEDELKARVDGLSCAELAEYVIVTALTNPALKNAMEEVGVQY